MVGLGLDQTAKYQTKLPEDVNYMRQSAFTDLLQHHDRWLGTELLLIQRNISTGKKHENEDNRDQ